MGKPRACNVLKNKKGMTLSEVIVALLIMTVLVTATIGMLFFSTNLFGEQSFFSQAKSIGDSVLEWAGQRLRYAERIVLTLQATEEIPANGERLFIGVDNVAAPVGRLYYQTPDMSAPLDVFGEEYYGAQRVAIECQSAGPKAVTLHVHVYLQEELRYSISNTMLLLNLKEEIVGEAVEGGTLVITATLPPPQGE